MQKLFDFIKSSPTAYHTVANIKARLISEGYTELYFGEKWKLDEGRGYFVQRSGSAIVAFKIPQNTKSFMIAAAHADSPAFKVKVSGENVGSYVRLPVERYGGMIMYSWLDRPLSLAGRIVVRTESGLKTQLVNIDKDLMSIPGIAIHFNRNVNDGYKFNPAKDMLPLISVSGNSGMLWDIVSSEAGVACEDIVNHDLFLYVREEPRLFGANSDLILSPRLDDLECVYASFEAFLSANPTSAVPVLTVFDNEEVGSATLGGADSSFLSDVLLRIAGSKDKYDEMLASSVAVSADNAHALHPNAPELSDTQNAPKLGGGIVIKYNANHRYATDGVGAALFLEICNKAGVKTQSYYNRADMPSGSTLGAILNTQTPVLTVDIGLCQLSMHSAVETANANDLDQMKNALKSFFETSVEFSGDEIKIN